MVEDRSTGFCSVCKTKMERHRYYHACPECGICGIVERSVVLSTARNEYNPRHHVNSTLSRMYKQLGYSFFSDHEKKMLNHLLFRFVEISKKTSKSSYSIPYHFILRKVIPLIVTGERSEEACSCLRSFSEKTIVKNNKLFESIKATLIDEGYSLFL